MDIMAHFIDPLDVSIETWKDLGRNIHNKLSTKPLLESASPRGLGGYDKGKNDNQSSKFFCDLY